MSADRSMLLVRNTRIAPTFRVEEADSAQCRRIVFGRCGRSRDDGVIAADAGGWIHSVGVAAQEQTLSLVRVTKNAAA